MLDPSGQFGRSRSVLATMASYLMLHVAKITFIACYRWACRALDVLMISTPPVGPITQPDMIYSGTANSA